MNNEELQEYCKKASEQICKQDYEIRKLQKESKILRDNAEHNGKVVDKVNWNNMLLKKENQELKKQLENYKRLGFKHLQDKNNNLETQQKEFINYLEKKINVSRNTEPFFVENIFSSYDLTELELNMLKEILQKYKSIIGVSDENNKQ